MAIYSTGSYNRVIGGQLQYRDTLVDKVGQQQYILGVVPKPWAALFHNDTVRTFLRRRKVIQNVRIKIVPVSTTLMHLKPD